MLTYESIKEQFKRSIAYRLGAVDLLAYRLYLRHSIVITLQLMVYLFIIDKSRIACWSCCLSVSLLQFLLILHLRRLCSYPPPSSVPCSTFFPSLSLHNLPPTPLNSSSIFSLLLLLHFLPLLHLLLLYPGVMSHSSSLPTSLEIGPTPVSATGFESSAARKHTDIESGMRNTSGDKDSSSMIQFHWRRLIPLRSDE